MGATGSLLPVPSAAHWRTKPPVAPVTSLHSFSVDTAVGRALRAGQWRVLRALPFWNDEDDKPVIPGEHRETRNLEGNQTETRDRDREKRER